MLGELPRRWHNQEWVCSKPWYFLEGGGGGRGAEATMTAALKPLKHQRPPRDVLANSLPRSKDLPLYGRVGWKSMSIRVQHSEAPDRKAQNNEHRKP